MTRFRRIPIEDLMHNTRTQDVVGGDAKVWSLNLDQIESGSGRILEKRMVALKDLGPSTYRFDAGTLLYSKLRPYLNKVVVADAPGYATTELVALRCDSAKLVPNFLAHYLRSPEFLEFANTVVAGAKMPRMVMSAFWRYEVPAPSLDDQHHIATILDQADALKAKRREALAQLDKLTQSIFIEMFGSDRNSPQVALRELCELITDGTHYTPTYVDTGTIFLSAKNVTSGYVDWDNIKYIPESLHLELQKRVAPRRGDVLLAKNGTTGIAAIVDRDCVFDIYVSLALLRPSSEVLSPYLHAAINSPLTKRQFDGALKGIGVPNLHLKDIRLARIPKPTLEAQKTFATRIQAVESLKAQHRAALTELDALFASLQYRAFQGEL